jgi:hypothetical protein
MSYIINTYRMCEGAPVAIAVTNYMNRIGRHDMLFGLFYKAKGRSYARYGSAHTHISNFVEVVDNPCPGKLPFLRLLSAQQTFFCGALLLLVSKLQAPKSESRH